MTQQDLLNPSLDGIAICEICGKETFCLVNEETLKFSCLDCFKFKDKSSYTKYHKEYNQRQKEKRKWNKFSHEEKVLLRDLLKSNLPNIKQNKELACKLLDQLDSAVGYVII